MDFPTSTPNLGINESLDDSEEQNENDLIIQPPGKKSLSNDFKIKAFSTLSGIKTKISKKMSSGDIK